MKKTFLFILLVTLFNSCFQEPNLSKPESVYKADVLEFLDQAKRNLADENVSKVDALKSSLDFKHVKTIKSPLGQQILVVPISSLDNMNDKYLNAIFYRNLNTKIDFSEIVAIDPRIENYPSNENLIEDLINNKSVSYSGKFSVYSVYQDLKFFNSFENGRITINGKVRSGVTNSKGGRETTCTAWYLTTTNYYSDGSSSSTTEYIGTTCDCVENQTRSSATMCDGGGDGGSSGSLPNNPSVGTLAQVTLPNGVMKLVEWKCDDAHCFWKDLGTTVPAAVVETNRPNYWYLPIAPYDGQLIFGPDGLSYSYNSSYMQWTGSTVYISKDPVGAKIAAIANYLKCLSKTKGGKVTVYVTQPTPGSRDAWSGVIPNPYVGHTFVSFQQDGVTRVFGFYPDVRPTLSEPTVPGVFFDDSGHNYDVKIEIYVDALKMSDAIDAVSAFGTTYDLNTLNCTDFGLLIGHAAGLNLPDTQGTWLGGGGSNPGDLGEDIRGMNSAGNVVVTKSPGFGPALAGECN
jgi:hypothetical protein